MKISKKKVVYAALGVFSVVALALTGATVQSSYKFHQGNILKKDMGYCNLNGLCLSGEALSAEERSYRVQVAVLSQYKSDGTFVGLSDDKLLWYPAIEGSIFSYADRNKPFSIPPIYLTTLERLNDYLGQGLTFVEGEIPEQFAKKVDALVLEKEEVIATGEGTKKVLRDFDEKEQELLASVIFKKPSQKTAFQFSDLVGVNNPEEFLVPSSGARLVVHNLLEKGGVLSRGETIESVAREVDVALSGRSLAFERLDVVTERFESAIVCRIPGSEGNNEVIMLPPKIELEMPNGDGPYLSAPKNILQLERVKSVEFADVIKELTGNPLEKAFGDTKDEIIKQVLIKGVMLAGGTLSTGGASLVIQTKVFEIPTAGEGSALSEEDIIKMSNLTPELVKERKARQAENLRQYNERPALKEKIRFNAAKAEANEISGEFSPARSSESQGAVEPQKTFVEKSSQGTAKSNTIEGMANDVMEEITGQPQQIMVPAVKKQTSGSSGGGSDNFNSEKGPRKGLQKQKKAPKSAPRTDDPGSNLKPGHHYSYLRVGGRSYVLALV